MVGPAPGPPISGANTLPLVNQYRRYQPIQPIGRCYWKPIGGISTNQTPTSAQNLTAYTGQREEIKTVGLNNPLSLTDVVKRNGSRVDL